MLENLQCAIDRHAHGRGLPTSVPRQFLVRQDSDLDDVEATYRPVLCFVAQGVKTVVSGPHRVRVGPGEMFVGLLRIPARVSFQSPYRSVMLDVSAKMLSAVVSQLPVAAPPEPVRQAFFCAPMDPHLISAVARWVGLLDELEHVDALAARMEEEILYRVLNGPLGPALRVSTVGGISEAVRAAAETITDRPAEPLLAQELAQQVGVSQATFYRRFRELTGMSPVQFQKLVRLQRAREVLADGATSATAAALSVGYVSVPQFSRDYRRQYGVPPGHDAALMRARSSTRTDAEQHL